MDAPYLESLNESQRAAVEATEVRTGPCRCGHRQDAGADDAPCSYLMTGRARPAELLSVTFTNKAAREMRTASRRSSAARGGWWLARSMRLPRVCCAAMPKSSS